jgi:hypothetical protein
MQSKLEVKLKNTTLFKNIVLLPDMVAKKLAQVSTKTFSNEEFESEIKQFA